MTIFKDKNWEIKVQISSKGTPYIYVYYKDRPMGFVNVGSFDTQKMFLLDICPDLIEKAKQVKKDYINKKGDN